MRHSSRIAITVIFCCAVAIAFVLLRPKNVPDTQQIQDQLESAVEGANQHSIGRIMAIVSSDYQDTNGLTTDSLREVLQQAYHDNPTILVSTTPPVIDVTGSTATSDSDLIVRENALSHATQYSHPLHLRWKKEHAYRLLVFPTMIWRVVSADYGQTEQLDERPYQPE